jgi:hypothetical protein
VSTEPTDRPTPEESAEPAAAPASGDAQVFAAEPPAQSPPKKRKAHIAHKVPGRIRMKVPAGKGNPEILEAYRKAFSAVPGITEVKMKPETGSIVIHYDPTREQEFEAHFHARVVHQELQVEQHVAPDDEVTNMARRIEAEAEFLAEHSELAKATVDYFKKFDRELKLATGNTVDMKILLAGGLAAYTFFEIGAGAATPMWVTLALFSLNHFAELHGPHLGATARPRNAPAPAPAGV